MTALVLVGAGGATPAQAGQYKVYVCNGPDGKGIPLERAVAEWATGWSNENYLPFSAAAESCGDGGFMGLFMGSPGAPTFYKPGTAARWVLRAPNRILAATLRRTVTTTQGVDQAASPEFILSIADNSTPNTVVAGCAAFTGCQEGNLAAGNSPVNDVAWPVGPLTSVLGLEVRCGGDPAGYCGNTGTARVTALISRLELTLADSFFPRMEGSASGTALSPGARTGVVSFVGQASDSNSGIYQVVATLGGTEVYRGTPNTNGGRCVDVDPSNGSPYEFRALLPCATDVKLNVPIDTARVPDGKRKLAIDLIDAAGNVSRVHESDIEIDNVPLPSNKVKPTVIGETLASGPRQGDVITSLDGAWEGAGITFTRRWQRSTADGGWVDIPNAIGGKYTLGRDDVDRQVRVVVTAANAEGATSVASESTPIVKSGATVQTQSVRPVVGGGDGVNGAGGNPSTGQLIVDREQRTVDVRYASKIVITGRLVDADTQPIADAVVDVFEQVAVTAAPWRKIGTVKTDSQGGYVFRPKTTASRRLRFAYSDQRDAADYRATREVFISVTAGMRISARRHVIRRRGVIKLRGRVQVDNLPSSGTWVEVQVLDSGVWRTVATRRTSSKGGWSFKHRLRQSGGITFSFRARLRPAGDIASAEAKSAPVKVRVR